MFSHFLFISSFFDFFNVFHFFIFSEETVSSFLFFLYFFHKSFIVGIRIKVYL